MLIYKIIILYFVNITYVICSKLSGRIIQGFRAYEAQFPWHASLIVDEDGILSLCGGSLISSKWIVTASHCIKDANNIEVNLGSVNHCDMKIVMKAQSFIKHPQYDGHHRKDIGLIELPCPVTFNDNIRPVSLPPKTMKIKNLVGKICLVCGFGRTVSTKPSNLDGLRYTFVRILSPKVCRTYGFFVNSNTGICAREVVKDRSICMGDSGGGLIYNEHGKSYVVGVVSFGSITCEGIPTAFQSVQMHLDWISNITGIQIPD